MISVTTPSDLRLYIQNDWITVAKGNNRTIQFSSTLPPVVTNPSNLVINGSTDINATIYNAVATSTSAPFSENQNFNYEVISPKVVYRRVENSSNITFIDVTRTNSYAHPHITTTNTAWMQNPYLNRGVIKIQKADSNGVFAPAVSDVFPDIIATITLDSQLNVAGLSTNTCKYRAIYEIRLIPNCGGTSPLIFQAIGDEFELAAYEYYSPAPIITTITNEPNKLLRFNDNNTDYITSEIQQWFSVSFNSSNIGYKYEYTTSSSTALPTSLQYIVADKKIEGLIDSIYPLTINTITFTGTENEFVNGQLVTTINPFIETKTNYIEGVSSDIGLFTQHECSYRIDITDNTLLSNPYYINRGIVNYEIYDEEQVQFVKLADIKRLETISSERCEQGTYTLRNRFTVRAIPNCGGTSDIIFQTEWNTEQITIDEYKPYLTLTEADCDYAINTSITVQPSQLNLNSTVCPVVPIADANTIKYLLYWYNGVSKSWELQNETLRVAVVLPATTSNNNYTFVATKLGVYRVVVELINCCEKFVTEQEYYIKDSYEVKQTTCNEYHIINRAYNTSQRVIVRYYLTNAIEKDITLASNETFKLILNKDGIYTIEINEKRYVIFSYCKLQDCYTKSIKDILCREDKCKDCLSVEDTKRLNELNEFRDLYQLWLATIEPEIRIPVVYTAQQLASKTTDLSNIDRLYSRLIQYCESCVKQLTDCGCV